MYSTEFGQQTCLHSALFIRHRMHDAITHVYVKVVELGFYSQSNLSDKDKVTFPLPDASLPAEAGSRTDSSEAEPPIV